MTSAEFVAYLVTGFGGGAIAIAVALKSVGKVVASAIEQRLQHTHDSALEALRSELSNETNCSQRLFHFGIPSRWLLRNDGFKQLKLSGGNWCESERSPRLPWCPIRFWYRLSTGIR